MVLHEKKKKFLVTLGFLLAGGTVLLLSQLKLSLPRMPPELALFIYNETASLPQGIYMRIPYWYLHEGDYVVYQPNEETRTITMDRGWLAKDGLLLKKVGAKEGGYYGVSPHDMRFSVQGKYFGQAFSEDREGKPVPVQYGGHRVPEGEFLPVGTSTRSFDGRYTGTVSVDNIKAKVVPLLTKFW